MQTSLKICFAKFLFLPKNLSGSIFFWGGAGALAPSGSYASTTEGPLLLQEKWDCLYSAVRKLFDYDANFGSILRTFSLKTRGMGLIPWEKSQS